MAAFMLEKLKPSPGCGTAMPLGSDPLSDNEYSCVQKYLAALDGGI